MRFATAAFALSLVLSPLGATARAETMPPVWVVGEEDDAQLTRCGLSYASTIASVEAALRYNRVTLASKDDWMAERALRAYVNLNAFEIESVSGRSTGLCAVSIAFFVGTATHITNPVSQKRQWARVEFCTDGVLATWNLNNAQTTTNARLRDYVDACVSKYEKGEG